MDNRRLSGEVKTLLNTHFFPENPVSNKEELHAKAENFMNYIVNFMVLSPSHI